MNYEEVRKAWVAALRSGEYKQGHQKLHSSEGEFCPLGVLCELAVKNGVIGEPALSGGYYVYARNSGVLPIEVANWVGMKSRVGSFFVGDSYSSIVKENDINNRSFAEISDLIENNPSGLFVAGA